MTAIDVAATMDGLAALMAGVEPNVYAWPVESVTVPCVVVGYPSDIELGITFGRGADAATFPVWVVVGRTGTKDARDALSSAITGSSDVHDALTGAHAFGDVDVQSVSVESITIAAVEYVGLKYVVEVV
jgi:hypothetical protein